MDSSIARVRPRMTSGLGSRPDFEAEQPQDLSASIDGQRLDCQGAEYLVGPLCVPAKFLRVSTVFESFGVLREELAEVEIVAFVGPAVCHDALKQDAVAAVGEGNIARGCQVTATRPDKKRENILQALQLELEAIAIPTPAFFARAFSVQSGSYPEFRK